jgi:TRAP-type C4-dicarboxylate transport system permease small subunit
VTLGGEPTDGVTRPPGDLGQDTDDLSLETSSLGREANAELLPEQPRLRAALRALGFAEQAVGTALIVVVLVMVLVQVAQRYLPGGWPWTGEVARLSLVWSTFALAGYLMAHDRHISIQIIDFVLPPRVLGAFKLLGHLVVALTCVALVAATYLLIADDIGQRTAAAEIPLAWLYVMPLLGFLFTALRAALAIWLVDLPEVGGRETTAR